MATETTFQDSRVLERIRGAAARLHLRRSGQWISLDSSAIHTVRYQRRLHILEVKFTHGGHYHYESVPPHIWREFLQSESKGRYFVQYIRNDFTCLKLVHAAPVV